MCVCVCVGVRVHACVRVYKPPATYLMASDKPQAPNDFRSASPPRSSGMSQTRKRREPMHPDRNVACGV